MYVGHVGHVPKYVYRLCAHICIYLDYLSSPLYVTTNFSCPPPLSSCPLLRPSGKKSWEWWLTDLSVPPDSGESLPDK